MEPIGSEQFRDAHGPVLLDAERMANAGKLAEAQAVCRQVLQAVPDHPEATALLGFLASRQGHLDAALELITKSIARRPDVPQWHFELRNIHRRAYRLDAALAAARQAVRLDPASARYLHGLGHIHLDRGELDAATACFLDALARTPDDAEVHLSLGQTLLARGEFRPGWAEYEWRFRTPLARDAVPSFTRPQWTGMRLPGRNLLLAADQGYGDGFQFARYIRMAAERCGSVILLCRQPQVSLLSRLPGVSRCVLTVEQAGEHAAFSWLGSLPGLFGTELNSIPATIPYLAPDPARRAHWRAELDRRLPSGRLRTGLVWAGNPANPADWRRSIPLRLLQGIARIDGIALASLQVPMPEADRHTLAGYANVIDLGPVAGDFAETAAVIANLDLIVTADTALAHLAGAMGLPTWVLVPQPADWRWLIAREDSPWFPSMKLFRQPRAGDWATPIQRLERGVERIGVGQLRSSPPASDYGVHTSSWWARRAKYALDGRDPRTPRPAVRGEVGARKRGG